MIVIGGSSSVLSEFGIAAGPCPEGPGAPGIQETARSAHDAHEALHPTPPRPSQPPRLLHLDFSEAFNIARLRAGGRRTRQDAGDRVFRGHGLAWHQANGPGSSESAG